MNIIIVGAGEIGRHLAIELSRQEHTVSVIESDALKASELQSEIEGRVVVGDGSGSNSGCGCGSYSFWSVTIKIYF